MARVFFEKVYLISIILFLAWIFLFGQGFQQLHLEITFWLSIAIFFFSLLAYYFGNFYPVDLAFLFYIFIVTLSLNFSEDKSIALNQYSIEFLSSLFLYFGLSKFDKKNSSIFCLTIFILSLIIVLIGILEFIFRKNIIYELWINNPFYQKYITNTPRIMSTLMHPKVFGSFLLACIPFIYFLSIQIKSLYKIFINMGIILSIFLVILSFTFGCIISLSILTIFYLYLNKKKKYIKYILLIIIILFIFSSTLLKQNPYFGRFSLERFIFEYHQIQVEIFKTTVNILKEHPFIGIGLNHYRLKFLNYITPKLKETEDMLIKRGIDPYEFRIPDNMYLSILSETGLLGFFSFIIFIFLIFKNALYNIRVISDLKEKQFIIASLSSSVGFLISMATYDMFYWQNPFFLFIIAISICIKR